MIREMRELAKFLRKNRDVTLSSTLCIVNCMHAYIGLSDASTSSRCLVGKILIQSEVIILVH